MNKNLLKNLSKEILKTKARFFSLIAITIIGVAMFTGINSTTSTMKQSANGYFEKQNMEDLNILSFSSFSENDLLKIKETINVKDVVLTNDVDVIMTLNKQELIARGLNITNVNKPYLISGNMPINDNEILADKKLFKINDKVLIKNAVFEKEYTVVGLADVVTNFGILYKGNNTLGLKKTDTIFYFNDAKKFSFIKNNKILITLNTNDNTFSSSYKDTLLKTKKNLESIFADSFISTRTENESFTNFKSDSEKIREIGAVFPLIFFITSALVSLSTMSRMIEDKRQENGLLKALGYSDLSIITFYLIYAFLASSLGLGFGLLIGYNLIPEVVLTAYNNVYAINDKVIAYDLFVGILASLISLGLVFLIVILILKQELGTIPATLMRPKAPPAGKRIFLEKVNFIWKKLNFTNKVTARNIFRYKKRFFMSIFGIMGCSALLLSAVGLKSSISPIKSLQYDNIYKYDLFAHTNDILELKTDLEHVLINNQIIEINKYNVNLMVSKDNGLEKMIDLNNLDLKKSKVIITKKLAVLLKLKVNDELIINFNSKEVKIKIGGICEHYFNHFIYFDDVYYKELFGNHLYNASLIKSNDVDKDIAVLLNNHDVKAAISNDYIKDSIGSSMSGVDAVVFVMIGFAGLLAIVVMYNLTIINLSERNRELATIKVLGFYDLELANYVYKENMILTIIGITCGLIIGVPLHVYIISSAEVSTTYFLKTMPMYNFIFTFLITLFFSIIVNILLFHKIKNIDMIESLKSLE